ncbi:MAG: hypothetical protein H6805_07340 [Planctomycetes bacterium]|nr:hypothetical protein [Planctomycetota bacterium]
MRRARSSLIFALALTLAVSVSMTSCGGKTGGPDPRFVLVSFNLPDISGIPLNQALILTFSEDVDPDTITLDTLRVIGATGPFFEATIVDGNLVALLPRTPNFGDYSDVGLSPNTTYTLSLPVYPATATIRTPDGKQLVEADSFFFRTLGTPTFVEPRRAVVHGLVPSQGGRSDDEGCLQNIANALYVSPQVDASVIQTGSGPGAALLCLRNEGRPRIIEPESFPRHDQQAVGTPSAVNPGLIDMPAIRLKVNEQLDPATVVAYNPATQIPANVQLWRVALKDGTPTGPDRIKTNEPTIVQTATSTEIILGPAAPIQQGVYVINVIPQVKDLPGNALRTDDRPNPAIGGYNVFETLPAFNANIPGGYRIYFQTLQVPNTALAIVEQFNSNAAEHGDNTSATTEPGVFTQSIVDIGTPGTLDGLPLASSVGGDPTPNKTLTYAPADPSGSLAGQSTTANWNEGSVSGQGFRFLNLPTLQVNPDAQPGGGAGLLRAVWRPYTGNGGDGTFNSPGNGTVFSFNTTSGSTNGDGIFEYESFTLNAGDTIEATGTKPLLILVRGAATIEGTIRSNGAVGEPGFNTDGTAPYANAASRPPGGPGGPGGAGGGIGGFGANPILLNVNGSNGQSGANVFGTWTTELATAGESPGGKAAFGFQDAGGTAAGSGGGGGGGFGTAGGDGTLSSGTDAGVANNPNGGSAAGTSTFDRLLTMFQPDRGYSPFANIVGGAGGGGGSADDDNGASEVGDGTGANGDDGGAGGGGGGGGICILAAGALSVTGTGIVQADGGDGGSTYSEAQLIFGDGDDGMAGTSDDTVVGIQNAVTPGGDGGPGGGGSGGGILLIGRTASMAGTLSAQGGTGGTSALLTRVAGDGGNGRIAIISFAGQALPTVTGTATPSAFVSAGASTQYNPTIELASVGQSEWVDLFTPTAEFAPDPDGVGPLPQQFPTFTSNFAGLTGLGLVQGAGADFDGVLEFQGADDLSPSPAGVTPTTADGLTQWVSSANITSINFKRYFRWRFRFFVSSTYVGHGGSANPMPQVFDLEIQFEKS